MLGDHHDRPGPSNRAYRPLNWHPNRQVSGPIPGDVRAKGLVSNTGRWALSCVAFTGYSNAFGRASPRLYSVSRLITSRRGLLGPAGPQDYPFLGRLRSLPTSSRSQGCAPLHYGPYEWGPLPPKPPKSYIIKETPRGTVIPV